MFCDYPLKIYIKKLVVRQLVYLSNVMVCANVSEQRLSSCPCLASNTDVLDQKINSFL